MLKASGKTTKGNAALLIPMALLAGVLTCVGLALGHLVLELEAAKSLGIGRTFLARWLEFAFLGGGIGAAVGAAVGGVPWLCELASTRPSWVWSVPLSSISSSCH